jgi:Domain of unknown function (DUF4291)
MTIETAAYPHISPQWPQAGNHIMAYQPGDSIVVYQAYKSSIARFAVANQCLGGLEFSYGRMSWIKPNFLWMMYRCGWAAKENQESVLAIRLLKKDFEAILAEAAWSSYAPQHHGSHTQWKAELESKEVRLQWDPDHDPFGRKLERRALQLGLKGNMLEKFGKQYITGIEDITGFVKEQKAVLDRYGPEKMLVPAETVFIPLQTVLQEKTGITLV